MLDLVLQKLTLYGGCSIPSIVFFLITRGHTIKHVNEGPPDWVLLILSLSEVLVPIAYNGRGTVLDRVICAVMAVVMTSGMLFYVNDRRRAPEGKPVPPFYEILARWNEKEPDHKKNDDTESKTEPSLYQIRQDAFKFLMRAVVYCLFYIPVFATMDGFIRVCREPPESFTSVSYLHRLTMAPIPWRTTFYYIWVGITLSLHIAIVPLVHLLLHAVQLNVVAWMPNANIKLLFKLHHDLAHFVAQPPLFDKPWMTRSVYDLWSVRWHQIFRPGFHQVAYNPVRRLFGPKKIPGRIAGTLAVFLCSGLMHDYIMLAMLGYSNYNAPGAFGYQTLFFLLQGVATIVSLMSPKLPGWLSRTLTWIWVLYTAPLFVEPYIRVKLHLHAEVPGFPKFMDSRIGVVCPYGSKI